MQSLNRIPPVSVIAALVLALSAPISFGQTAPGDAAEKIKARELEEAIETCDKGASVPLDFAAKAPPVQYSELALQRFDKARLKALQENCYRAWVGAPTERGCTFNGSGPPWLLAIPMPACSSWRRSC